MTDQTPTPGNNPAHPVKTLSDLSHEAIMLASAFEGLEVIVEQMDGSGDDPTAKRARNGAAPILEMLIKAAWALQLDIERADTAQRRAAAGKAA